MSQVRANEPVREQGIFRWEMPEDALPDDHPARLFWRVVGTLDLSGFTRDAKALEGRAGRNGARVGSRTCCWLTRITLRTRTSSKPGREA